MAQQQQRQRIVRTSRALLDREPAIEGACSTCRLARAETAPSAPGVLPSPEPAVLGCASIALRQAWKMWQRVPRSCHLQRPAGLLPAGAGAAPRPDILYPSICLRAVQARSCCTRHVDDGIQARELHRRWFPGPDEQRPAAGAACVRRRRHHRPFHSLPAVHPSQSRVGHRTGTTGPLPRGSKHPIVLLAAHTHTHTGVPDSLQAPAVQRFSEHIQRRLRVSR